VKSLTFLLVTLVLAKVCGNELKNDFMGRQELDFGGIDCEFWGLSSLASTSV